MRQIDRSLSFERWTMKEDDTMDEREAIIPVQQEKQRTTSRKFEEKTKITNRLKRIEGQVRGLQNMVESDRYCVDILIQISAVQAALKKVGFTLLETHTKECVAQSIKDEDSSEEMIDELMKVIQLYGKS